MIINSIGGRTEPRRRSAEDRHRLTLGTGLAGLSLDAIASVAYGPEAIVLVLATAGSVGLGFTLPVTLAIVVLLTVLVASYRQVIAAFPNGGGAYAVAKSEFGDRPALTAAAALILDYVLNVAVSIAAGVAALTSAFPALRPYTLWLCLLALGVICALNLRGIACSARAFMLPTLVFTVGIGVVVVAGLLRHSPAATLATAPHPAMTETVGALLLLRAFSAGCAALTGVEAIANAVPSFRAPRVRTAQRTETVLGALLAAMLIGLAVLIGRFAIHPSGDATVLAQVTAAALGQGPAFYVMQFATALLLALAANTSFGGLPTLLRLLADDNCLPHRFAQRSRHDVYRYGVLALTGCSAVLLLAARGSMNALVPLFAIGVFVGFSLAQAGLVRHWLARRTPGWRWRCALNGFGAVLTTIAAVVTVSMKFTAGAWLIVLALPALVVLMERVRAAYTHIGAHLRPGATPEPPGHTEIGNSAVVVVPVSEVSELSRAALSTAMAMRAGDVVAVHVCCPGTPIRSFARAWESWGPDIPLILLDGAEVAPAVVGYVRRQRAMHRSVIVVLGEVRSDIWWHRMLPGRQTAALERALRRDTDAAVCRSLLRVCSDPRIRAGWPWSRRSSAA